MVRRYEMVLVAAPVLSEEDYDKQITAFEELIAERGGQVHKVDRWGRRKLAFPISKFQEGNYTLMLYDAEPEVEREFVRRVKLSDHYLRFLSVRADHERIPTPEEKAALEEARREHIRRAAERAEQGLIDEPLDQEGSPIAPDLDEDAFDEEDWGLEDGEHTRGPRGGKEDE